MYSYGSPGVSQSPKYSSLQNMWKETRCIFAPNLAFFPLATSRVQYGGLWTFLLKLAQCVPCLPYHWLLPWVPYHFTGFWNRGPSKVLDEKKLVLNKSDHLGSICIIQSLQISFIPQTNNWLAPFFGSTIFQGGSNKLLFWNCNLFARLREVSHEFLSV